MDFRRPPPPAAPALRSPTHLGRARRGGSVPRGPGPRRWSRSGERRWVLTWGPRRRERAGCPGAARCGAAPGAAGCPRAASRRRRVSPRSSEQDGGRRVRVSPADPGQRRSAELAALALLFLSRGVRSGGGWVGAKGRGRGRGGPRGAAARRGLRRSRVPARGPGHPPRATAGQGRGPRGQTGGKSGLGRQRTQSFLINTDMREKTSQTRVRTVGAVAPRSEEAAGADAAATPSSAGGAGAAAQREAGEGWGGGIVASPPGPPGSF